MSESVFQFFLCLGLVLLALSCFQSEIVLVRRLGGVLLVVSTGLALWYWTENAGVAVCGMLAWVVVPVGQAAYMSRRLSISLKRRLEDGHFDEEEFPDVIEVSQELRGADFESGQDYWLKPSPIDQGYRLMAHRDKPIYAAVAVLRHGIASLSYLIFVTPDRHGKLWLTWDYPLAYGLMMPPQFMVHRCLEAESAVELFNQHEQFLELNHVECGEVSRELAPELFERLFARTIEHNMEQGLLRPLDVRKESIGYTWRGTAFVSWQVLCEVVKG